MGNSALFKKKTDFESLEFHKQLIALQEVRSLHSQVLRQKYVNSAENKTLHRVKNQNIIGRTYGEPYLIDMLHWNKRHLSSDTQEQGLGDQVIKISSML